MDWYLITPSLPSSSWRSSKDCWCSATALAVASSSALMKKVRAIQSVMENAIGSKAGILRVEVGLHCQHVGVGQVGGVNQDRGDVGSATVIRGAEVLSPGRSTKTVSGACHG